MSLRGEREWRSMARSTWQLGLTAAQAGGVATGSPGDALTPGEKSVWHVLASPDSIWHAQQKQLVSSVPAPAALPQPVHAPSHGRGRAFGPNRRPDTRPAPKRTRLAGDHANSTPGLAPLAPVAPAFTAPPPSVLPPVAPTPAPVACPLPVDTIVRLGPVSWSENPSLLRDQLFATARMAWEALPSGSFAAVQDLRLDAGDRTFALVQFPSLSAALSFVDRWVENMHRAPSLAAVQARIV
ncbi:hypothetical protein OH77DRAFT_1526008 [Trametes cingulata]|nr:hypothetical protein OH77DRAFT_1526008 [Trametes cingulata]